MRFSVVVFLFTLLGPALSLAHEDPSHDPLPSWRIGLYGASTRAQRFDVFERPGLPPGPVEEKGEGGGVNIGHRFGDRFILDLQVLINRFDIEDGPEEMVLTLGNITGTVLFRQDQLVQPYLRGGIGGAGMALQFDEGQGHLYSYGTGAVAGGGIMFRVSRHFSLEFEALAAFVNHLEVDNEASRQLWPEDSWSVRESSQSWSTSLGVSLWF